MAKNDNDYESQISDIRNKLINYEFFDMIVKKVKSSSKDLQEKKFGQIEINHY